MGFGREGVREGNRRNHGRGGAGARAGAGRCHAARGLKSGRNGYQFKGPFGGGEGWFKDYIVFLAVRPVGFKRYRWVKSFTNGET